MYSSCAVWGDYLHAHIHLRLRHAHHETKDWLPSLGCRAGGGKGAIGNLEASMDYLKNPKCLNLFALSTSYNRK